MKKSAVLVIGLLGISIDCTVSVPHIYAAPQKQKQTSKPKSVTKPKRITEKEALEIVSRLPAVRKWRQDVVRLGKKQGVTPEIDVDHEEGGSYVVHVYELVPDGKDSSHTATMNWYNVNAKTGRVTNQF